MRASRIPYLRLVAQRLAGPGGDAPGPAEVVAHLGAVQAQDYLGSLWAIGARSGASEAEVERAVAERQIVRTWPMRGTLHFVPAADVRWMVELLAARPAAGASGRHRQLGLDTTALRRSETLLVKALEGGRSLARPAAYEVLERGGVSPAGQRGIHVLGFLAQRGVLCFGPRQGKQPAFVLRDEWLPGAKSLPRDEALERIAHRYFAGHGPATLRDFVWWTGLRVAEAKAALALAAPRLVARAAGDGTWWMAADTLAAAERGGGDAGVRVLPPFDEYLVGYKDRRGVLDPELAPRVWVGGVFRPFVLDRGRVVGTWRRAVKKRGVAVAVAPFEPFGRRQAKGLDAAVEEYRRFLALPAARA